MKLAFVQTRPVFGDVHGNVRRAMKRAETLDADLIVLPELFTTGYCFKSRAELKKLAEPARGGVAVAAARGVAQKTGARICGGFAEAAGKKLYNSAFLVGPDGLVAVYRKIHLFADETRLFDSGNRPFAVHDIGVAKVGMMICFDWTMPESMRSLMILGAQVVAHPSNLVMPWCQHSMVTRCLENGVFAVTANRVGSENRTKAGHLTFTGRSQITGVTGEVLCSASKGKVESAAAEIDPAAADAKRFHPRNDVITDRRPKLYSLD